MPQFNFFRHSRTDQELMNSGVTGAMNPKKTRDCRDSSSPAQNLWHGLCIDKTFSGHLTGCLWLLKCKGRIWGCRTLLLRVIDWNFHTCLCQKLFQYTNWSYFEKHPGKKVGIVCFFTGFHRRYHGWDWDLHKGKYNFSSEERLLGINLFTLINCSIKKATG